MDRNYCVYMHKNKLNNKVYIGITGQKPELRWNEGKGYKYNSHFYAAINKYGWYEGFEHIILYDNLTKEEAETMEIKTIEKYDATNQENGYNIQLGGNLNHTKYVYQYDRITGNYIKKWCGTIAIEKELHIPNADISAVCLGKVKTAHDFYFSYEYLGDKLPMDIFEWINRNDCFVKLAQYDLQGNFINIYDTISQASSDVSNDSIAKIQSKNKTSFGYIWKRVIDNNKDYTQNLSNKELKKYDKHINEKPCYMYDNNGKFMKRFNSTTEAAKVMKLNQGNIASACRGEYKKCGNYFWKYEEDSLEKNDLKSEELESLNLHGLSKEVYKFNLDGKFIKKYNKISTAAEENNLYTTNISKCCNREIKQAGGYIWRYFQDDITSEDIKSLKNNKRHRKVEQYDMKMNYIQTFESIAEAERQTGARVNSIIQCCNGKYKHANGYKWKYVD